MPKHLQKSLQDYLSRQKIPKHLQKSFQEYLSKIKKHTSNSNTQRSSSLQLPRKILSGCKNPKTPSFAIGRGQNLNSSNNSNSNSEKNGLAATLSDIDRFLCENFKSLYLSEDHEGSEPSFSIDDRDQNLNNSNNKKKNNGHATSLSEIDRFLYYENIKSLYLKEDHEDNKKKKAVSSEDHRHRHRHHHRHHHHQGSDDHDGGVLFGAPRFFELPRELCGSNRFFVAPGLTGSLMEEARLSLTVAAPDEAGSSTSSSMSTTIARVTTTTTTLNDHSNESKDVKLPEDCITVLTHSPNPYDDFRRSMQEMVEARVKHKAKVDWDFMEELLFCYLDLNDKKSHKFILSAFADLTVVLRQNSSKIPARSRNSRVPNGSRRKKRNVT